MTLCVEGKLQGFRYSIQIKLSYLQLLIQTYGELGTSLHGRNTTSRQHSVRYLFGSRTPGHTPTLRAPCKNAACDGLHGILPLSRNSDTSQKLTQIRQKEKFNSQKRCVEVLTWLNALSRLPLSVRKARVVGEIGKTYVESPA